jgi:Zn-dependent protease
MELLFSPIILQFLLPIFIIIYSAILHEIAHGFVAERLGDPTARLLGRLTLNPIPHIDPIFSLLIPLLLLLSQSGITIGGAKPVPVDMFNLRDGRKDMALVALAGPLTNIVLAILAAILLKLLFPNAESLTQMNLAGFLEFTLKLMLRLNLSLAIFNLLPIPPLDGSKVFSLILPEREANSYLSIGSAGIVIILFLLMMPIGPFSLTGIIATINETFLKLLGF